MNFAEIKDNPSVDQMERHTGRLTRRERQIAIVIGAVAGGTGGYAVFASSNQAGTVLLLLIALIFLLVGVEGTPLLWFAVRPGAHRPGKRRLDKTAPRIAPKNPQLGVGMAEDFAMPEQLLIARPAISPSGTDDENSLYTAE